MWQVKTFKTPAIQKAWCEKNKHRYQIVVIYINNDGIHNGYAVEYRPLQLPCLPHRKELPMNCEETELTRRAMLESGQPARDLEQAAQRWTTAQLGEDFEVIGFMAPFVVVRRKSDGKKGSLEFTHSPRVYFNFVEDQ